MEQARHMTVNPVRYAKVFLIMMFAMLVLSVVTVSMFGISIPPGLTAIIPAIFAAQSEGRARIRDAGETLDGVQAWGAALAMTAIAVMFLLVLFLIQLAAPGVIGALTEISRSTLWAIYGLVLLIILLINRLFFGLGQMMEQRG